MRIGHLTISRPFIFRFFQMPGQRIATRPISGGVIDLEKRYLVSRRAVLTIALVIATGHHAFAKVEYDSNQLRMKNAEEFSAIVKRKIKLATNVQSRQKLDLENGLIAEPEAVAYLTDALRIVLSRPDQDATVDDLYNTIRHELQDLNSFGDATKSLTAEAIHALKDSSTSIRDQGTYVAILNNLVAEVKPDLRIGNDLFKTVESIRDAQLNVSDKLKNQAFLRQMKTPVSPSETAKAALSSAKPATARDSNDANSSEGTKRGRKKDAKHGSRKSPATDEEPDLDD